MSLFSHMQNVGFFMPFLFNRITLVSDELSQILWSGVHPFLGDIEIDGDPHDHNIHGVPSLLRGRWSPIGLNNAR